jgi:pilus assembly protein Flp/PilA
MPVHTTYLKRFLSDESGPTAAEYAVLLALIIMAVIGAVTTVGSSTSGIWLDDVSQITAVTGS